MFDGKAYQLKPGKEVRALIAVVNFLRKIIFKGLTPLKEYSSIIKLYKFSNRQRQSI